MRTALLYFTENGRLLAEKITKIKEMDFVVFDKETKTAKAFVREGFGLDAIVFVGAVGIAVRLIAPHLVSKERDPAVLVIDERGEVVIPILSGHIGGANELAASLAKQLGATPILTTATDLNGVFAVDVWSTKSNCAIGDISHIKEVSAALLRGEEVGLWSDFVITGALPKGVSTNLNAKIGILVSTGQTRQVFETTLHVIPKTITLGVGCKKHTEVQAFESTVLETLQKQDISIKSLEQIASIDLKNEEVCIKKFCEKYHIAFHTFSAAELAGVAGKFTTSEFVKKTTGVDNVCERSAVLGSGGGELILKKKAKDGITLAIAAKQWRGAF